MTHRTAMNGIGFTARKKRDFHWAWYLAPIGTVAIVLLSVIVLRAVSPMMPGEGPAPTLAKNAMPIAAKTTVMVPSWAPSR